MVSSSGSDTTTLLLGRYRVEATLGEGSFGTVVRAFDSRLKRVVAIKTLKRALATADIDQFRAVEERFAREAEAGSRMGIHPNLVTVHDLVIEPDHTQYLILEYVRGGTLGERLRGQPMPLHEALRITADVARGLQAAHDVGIVHRDIKPANIFLAADGRAQVGDFGIAQIDDVSGRTHTTIRHPGTPLYMSPEQAQTTGYVRPASDQYSLGLVLFELLTGQAYKRLGERAATSLLETQPAGIANLVEDMVATNPDDRLPSCAHVIRRIQAIARQQGLTETQLAVENADIAAERIAARPPGEPVPPPGSSDPSGAIALISTPPIRPAATDGARKTGDAAVAVGAADVTVPLAHTSGTVERAASSGGGTTGAGFAPPGDDAARYSVADPGGARSRRGAILAAIAGVAVVAIVAAALFVLRGAPHSPPVTATAPPAATPIVALPTATAAATATAVPTAIPTIAPTLAPTVAPTPTTAPSPTAAPTTAPPPSTLAIFSAGTTDQKLDTVQGDDVVTQFTVGQEVYGFVNFGGARANTDAVDVTLAANGTPQAPQHLTLPKTDGFIVFSLGKLDIGNYQLIVSYNGKVAKTADFRVSAAAPVVRPTAVPVRPSGGTTATYAPVTQPTTAPVTQPTSAPVTQPTAAPAPTKPVIVPTQAPLKP